MINKQKILNQSLKYISKFGFTQNTLNRAISDFDLSPAAHRIVDRGPVDIVYQIQDAAYQKAYDQIQQEKNEYFDFFQENLKHGIKAYINEIGKYSDHWDQAMYLLSHYGNVLESWDRLTQFSEKLSYLCGTKKLGVSLQDKFYFDQKQYISIDTYDRVLFNYGQVVKSFSHTLILSRQN